MRCENGKDEKKIVAKQKLKIGIVTPHFFPHPGGVSIHVLYQYLHLRKLGFDVKVISPNFGRTDVVPPEDHIKLGRPIPIIYNGSLTYISFSFRAKEVLSEEKFDLVHVHEPYSPFSLWFIKSCERNIGTFHAFKEEPEKILVKISKPFLKILRRKIGVAIAVSKTSAGIIEGIFGVPHEKIRIVPNGIDFERFANAEPLPEFSDGFNILFVGRLEPRKGVKHLIRAYRTVKRIIPESRLIIAGGGMKTYYMSFVTEDIEKSVIFTGKVPDDVLPRLYKSADLCVFPSTRGESFGIVLLEAMASGKPVISGNAEGYREILKDGEYGVIVNPKDEDSLARAIVELYFREEKRKKLAEKGKEYAKQFDWKNVIIKLLSVYYEYLGIG